VNPVVNPVTGGTPAGDALTLLIAVAWVLVPGVLVLAAGGVRRLPVLLGAAPAVSIGVSTLAASVTGLLDARFSWWTVLVATAVAALLGFLVRGRRAEPLEGGSPRAPLIAAGTLVVAAAATTCELFRRGLGTLATPSQEHDAITHTLVIARILRTGNAEPWAAQALDVVTGDPAQYYPNGLHQWAALIAQTRGVDAVSGLNATSVVVLAVVQTLGLLALAARVLPPTWLPAGGVAAVAASLAYQPLQAMHHDSGALPNAAAIAFAPGVIALLLPPGRVTGRAVAALVPALTLACAGVVTVHPSAALTVAGGFLACFLVTLLLPAPTRAESVLSAGKWVAGLAAAGVLVAALVGTALAQAASSGGGSSSRFERDVPVESLPDALHRILTLPLQGGLDPADTRSQWWIAAAVVLGALLAGRKGLTVLLTWLVWSLLALGYLLGWRGSVLDLVWDSAWNSYYRVAAHGSSWAWLLAGVAVVRIASFARRSQNLAAATLGVVLLAGSATESFGTEVGALQARYADPEYQRIDTDDLAAARYLAEHVHDGERVLNSGNDGSTYGYVLHDVPIMATTAVPGAAQPELRTLLRDLRQLTPQVRELLQDNDVTYVVVDAEAPGLPLKASDAQFYGVDAFAVPPGLVDLDGVDGLRRVFTSGSVGVWQVTLS